MSRVLQVFVREYLENVRTKAFLVGLILTPLWFVLAFAVPMLAEEAERPPQRVTILDTTGTLATDLAQEIQASSRPGRLEFEVTVEDAARAFAADAEGATRADRLRGEAARGDRFLLVVTPATLAKAKPGAGEPAPELVGASNVGAEQTGRILAAAVTKVVNRRILAEGGYPADLAERLARPAADYRGLTREGEEAGVAQMLAPMAFMLLLFMGIVGISQMLVSSTLEEKSNRVYEVLLSSLSPFQLMTGKLLGICAVGFTLMVLWSSGGLLAAALQGVGGIITGGQMGLLLAYYFLGFFLIASLMAAVGSACNTLKEAQNLMAPVSLLLAFPLLLSVVILRNPNGMLATIASFVPPFTPFLMMARIGSVPSPPAWQVVASLVLLAGSTLIALRLAARVFRVGILLYGQPPSLRQIWRWMRAAE